MNEITLFPHNEEAYQNLVKSLEDNNLSFIERATGTGKSYILIKYMASFFAGKKVLFVTTHNSMFKQLSERDMANIGTSKDIYEKLDCILYSSINKHDAEWYYDNYDCIIFDEAHHCGAPKWGKTIEEIKDLFKSAPNKKMIGATATGIRYLDNYRNIAEEFFDGNIASKLYLSDAMLQEILPVPYYININTASLDILKNIKKKLMLLGEYRELDPIRERIKEHEKEIEKKLSVNELLKKHNIKAGEKYVVFCSSIEELQRKKEEIAEWFKDIAPIEIYEAYSKQSSKLSQKQIDEFEKASNPSTIKLMLAVDMFNEGLHISGVDGIIMTRKTSSPIIYLQQLGRALSFSSRKKTIKVFDLVGNATTIDVIYNLYKELLAIAKQQKDNNEHYQEVIKRFKIVDEGTELLDKLEMISSFLDENYLNKEKIKKYISILKNYVTSLNIDFMEALRNRQIDKEHYNIYISLQRLSESLSFNDFMELTNLGIYICQFQKDQIYLEKIKKYGSLKVAKDKELKDFIAEYNLFYLKNNRRPDKNKEDEKLLREKYREYLYTLKPSVIAKILKDCSFPLNIEEKVLLKDYPDIDSINEYLDYITSKYEEGISLDELEKRTINLLSKIISVSDRPIIKTIINNHVIKIDESIKVLKKYLESHPNTTFENAAYYQNIPYLKKALNDLNKYAKAITNKQFETLLSLSITLPDVINMTLEQRIEELGPYESFEEKQIAIKSRKTKQVSIFISKYKRRPNINNQEERELALEYLKIIKTQDRQWSKRIINTLINNNIPLNIDEKIISNENITPSDLSEIYDSVMIELKNIDKETFDSTLLKKKIKILKNNKYIYSSTYKVLLRTITIIEYIFSDHENYGKERIAKYMYNNQAVIPFSLIGYIYQEYGISLLSVNKQANNRDDFINILHKKNTEQLHSVQEYFDYIKENKERPPQYTVLSQNIRKFLARADLDDIQNYCNVINSLGIPLTNEEMYLLGKSPIGKSKELYQQVLERRRKSEEMDELDKRLYPLLYSTFELGEKQSIINQDDSSYEVNKEIKKDLIEDYKMRIKENPQEELDFGDTYLTEGAKEELRKYRLVCLGESFITNLINRMKRENKPYKQLLDEKELELLNIIIKHSNTMKKNTDLIADLMKLNKEILIKINSINIEELIKDYLLFIEVNNREPNIDSDNQKEHLIAYQYSILQEVLTTEEKKQLLSTIKIQHEKLKKQDFYESFISFVELNKRFPTILSNDQQEKELAKEYQKNGSKLSSEQRLYINKLLKKYQMNTLMYARKHGGN